MGVLSLLTGSQAMGIISSKDEGAAAHPQWQLVALHSLVAWLEL